MNGAVKAIVKMAVSRIELNMLIQGMIIFFKHKVNK
jgi:hypothetical protein